MTIKTAIVCAAACIIFVASFSPCVRSGNASGPADRDAKKRDESPVPEWMARWELAKVLSYAKRYDESVVEYRRLIREKPDLYKARNELAVILFWQGKKSEAKDILENIPPGRLDEDSKAALADIYVSLKEYKKAEPLYRSYLERNRGDQRVRLRLADALSWDKRYEQAIEEYRLILDALPDDVQVRRRYARVLGWAGRYQEAAQEMRKTLNK